MVDEELNVAVESTVPQTDHLNEPPKLEPTPEPEEEKDNKKRILLLIIIILLILAIVGGAIGIYFALQPKGPRKVKVIAPETSGLVVNNKKAYIGRDYDTDISVDMSATGDRFLPNTLTKVTSGDITILDTEYTYSPEDSYEKATLHIPGEYVKGDITIDFSLVFKRWYQYPDWWNYCSNGVEGQQATEDDVKTLVPLTVNNQVHQVRLIDVDKDFDNKGNTIHTTFEFANFLSDENGYSFASLWQNASTDTGGTYNYLDSTIRMNLVGKGGGEIMWYEKGGTAKSDRNQTVLDMLPSGLKYKLKIVRKKINMHTTGSWVETDVEDELFLLSPKEMGYSSELVESEVPIYKYYKGHTDQEDAIRIKQQVKGAEGAITSTYTVDCAAGKATCSAGYNSMVDGQGSWALLRSPCIKSDDNGRCPWMYDEKGWLTYYAAAHNANNIAPAFCI